MLPWDWQAEDLSRDMWCRTLSQRELECLQTAVDNVSEVPLAEIKADNFPLGQLSSAVADMAQALSRGVGFRVWQGIPVDRYTLEQQKKLYWGLCQHLGTPVAQSYRGDVIGDVRDIGTGISGKKGRGYTSKQALNYHTDAADVTGLFYLKNARSGGVNGIASAQAVHDEIARRRPDLLEILYQPFYWSWQGNQPEDGPDYYQMPVFGRSADGLACAYVRTNILQAQANAGAPPMRPEQIEAVEFFAAVASEPQFGVTEMFAPGSLFFINNHRLLHMRTEFEDWSEPERKRHLLRVWLSSPSSQALPLSFAEFFRDAGAGQLRGGYISRSGAMVYTTNSQS